MRVQRKSAYKPSCAVAASAEPEHRVLGVDASLSSTGYAYCQDGKLVTGTITTDPLRGSHRLFYVRKKLDVILSRIDPTLIVLEDYAMGAGGRMNNNVFKIGELGGVLKLHFWENGFDVLPVSPTALKSVIALTGSAKKEDIVGALASRFGIDVKQHDEADAAGLMLVGEMKCGIREVTTQRQSKAKSDRFESVRQTEVLRGKPATKARVV